MKKLPLFFACLLALAAGALAKPSSLQIEATGAPELTLRGKDARQQLLVTAKLPDGALRDFTHQVTYTAEPAGIVSIDASGIVKPVADGTAAITADADGVKATLTVKVQEAGRMEPVNFANE